MVRDLTTMRTGGNCGNSGARAARLVKVSWATLLYKSRKKPPEPLRRLREIAAPHVRYGYRHLTVLLRR